MGIRAAGMKGKAGASVAVRTLYVEGLAARRLQETTGGRISTGMMLAAEIRKRRLLEKAGTCKNA